jgi:ribose transport system permease protein
MQRAIATLLAAAPLVLYLGMLIVFSVLSPRFRTVENFENILIQSSSAAVVAVGMTFVLLTAGIDLSVGAVMFLGAAAAGKLVLLGAPVPIAMLAMLLVGLACGLLNALLVTWFRAAPFIVTLSLLFVERGAALWITETKAINLPDMFRQLATARLAGIPVPALVLFAVAALSHVVLTQTPLGRHLYAFGNDTAAARKAGLPVARILTAAYVLCSGCAALGGLVSLAQLSAVSPTFGRNRELEAIAAAVLGGVSLFGGRGSVPGALLGAITIHTIYNGLNVINADPYLYPLITSSIIFLAVLLDSLRQRNLARRNRRQIRNPRPHVCT